MDSRDQSRANPNPTHASTTDPDARLFKKAEREEAALAYLGQVLMDNRHGLTVALTWWRKGGYSRPPSR